MTGEARLVAGRGVWSALAMLALTLVPLSALADPDLPGPSPNPELVPAGSLVIPMDNAKQNLVAPFNLKAYGLVNSLLWEGIPVKWAIKTGKAKDGIDFSGTAQRILPTTLPPAALDFRAGPFVVHADWADYARQKAAAWGNNVAVYELTADVPNVDVRYTLTQRRRVGVLDDGGNANIHTDILIEAGFTPTTHFEVLSVVDLTTLNGMTCYSTATEAHFSSGSADTQVEAARAFLATGGNFLAQCAGIETYENNVTYGLFQTDNGLVVNNIGSTPFLYPNADLAWSQFHGALADEGGSTQDFKPAAGSSFRANTHAHAQNTPATDLYAATATKVNPGSGSLVFYLGGHKYDGTNIEVLNGRRMYMNAVLIPSIRPAGCGLDFPDEPSNLRTLSGTVFEDVNGDSLPADAVGAAGVDLRIYSDDNASGLVDAGDTLVETATTDLNGDYSVTVNTSAAGDVYLVAVDSRSVVPGAGFNGGFGQTDVWAEQTYGDDPSSPALDVGSRLAGRAGGVSDRFNPSSTSPADNAYQHVARVDVGPGNLAGVDFGFSFNVVTNIRGEDDADDDPTANRTIQGSLRQFMHQANAISGANTMRFVPAVPANATGGGGAWWRITIALDGSTSFDLPLLADPDTVLDGTSYSASDGTSLRDENPGNLGTGGFVGADQLPLAVLGRPELEITSTDPTVNRIGLDVQSGNVTIRRLAIFGFGEKFDDDEHANIRVGDVSGTLIEANLIGAAAASFSDPGTAAQADNIRVALGDAGTIRDNLIGFADASGIRMSDGADGWTIEGNEIHANSTTQVGFAGVFASNSGATTIRANLFRENKGAGFGLASPTAGVNLENNTFTRNGIGTAAGTETAGVRLTGTDHTVDRNLLYENFGPGVMVTSGSTQNTLTRNSIHDNGTITNDGGAGPTGQIGIDLLRNADDQRTGTGPFVTLNDSGDGDSGGNGLLNHPILESAGISGGLLTITGYARPGSQIELFVAEPDPSGFGEGKTYLATFLEGSGADLDATSGSYGPGRVNNIFQGQDTTNRFRFDTPAPVGVGQGTLLTATAILGASTSEFSAVVAVDPFTISGTVQEDPNADSDLTDGVARSGVTVTLYADGGDGNANGVDDVLVNTSITDGGGNYSFGALGAGVYWLTVDSRQIEPGEGFNAGFSQSDVWADQTYGPVGALCADGSGGTTELATAGACYGGRLGGVSDDAASLASAGHVTRIMLTTASVSADFGFSFNVVTNARAGDGADDDPSSDRTVQGSLRQFLVNANAIANANPMRFVPATPANTSGGGGAWWRVLIAGDSNFDLPLLDDPGTALDGTAYALADGTTLRDENPGTLGTGGVVGVDGLVLPAFDRPELEITSTDPSKNVIGLDVQANNVVIRRVALYGFGTSAADNNKANIRVADVTGTLIEENVIGAGASSFSQPATSATSDNIRSQGADGAILRNNLIGFSGGNGVGLKDGANDWTIEGNEIRGNGTDKTELRGVSLEKCSGATLRGNLVWENKGVGIDTKDSTGGHTIENNTISGNGVGANETAGIRLYGTSSSIDRNLIFGNYGAGLLVTPAATQNVITRNSFFDNGEILDDAGGGPSGQIGIDLLTGGDDVKLGTSPFRTLNDSGDGDGGANDLVNFPILSGAILSGNLVLTGFARPGSTIEVYIADPDPSGFGEGSTYLVTLVEGSGSDLDSGTGSYGPGPINSRIQGQDTTERFRFDVAIPPGVTDGTRLTATATVGGQTSEFSGTVTATASNSISGTVFEDVSYGGGPGRNLVGASGAPVPGAEVELYDSLGNFLTSTTTAADGTFVFGSLGSADYFVRVVNETVESTRSLNGGYSTADTLPVQTFRNDPLLGDVIDEVGGARPDEADAPANDTTQTLADLDALPGREVQSATPVTVGAVGVAELDFGFNFDTIVNTNDAGQGSLRQFIDNSNALANSGLEQLGYVAGVETSLFMIPSDTDPLSRPVDPGFDVARGVAVITLASVLPALQDAATAIDGSAQTDSVGDTNPGQFDHPEPEFAGNKDVGTAGASLPGYFHPEIEIDGNDQGTILEIAADGGSVRGVALFNAPLASSAIRFTAGSGGLLTESFIGARADGTDPGAGLRLGSGVEMDGGEADVKGNLLAFTEDNAIVIVEAGEVSGNEIYRVALSDPNGDGISTEGSTGQAIVIRENRIDRPSAFGIESWLSPGPFVIEDNTVSRAGSGSVVETGGIRIFGSGSTVRHNVVTGTAGSGIVLVQRGTPGSNQQNRVSENRVYGNGGPSIDIDITNTGATDNPAGDGVTGNDGTTDPTLPNADMDYPVFTSVIPSGGMLHVEGYVGTAGSAIPGTHTIEVFKADDDGNNDGEVERLDGQSEPHGEGRWFIDSCTTALDGTFVCDLTVPGAVSFGVGDVVTGSAIDSTDNTSELGPNATATALSLVKRAFQVDGTPIISGSTLPPGMPVKFLLYVSNPGGMVVDVSMRDVLDPLFLYSAGTIRYDNSVTSCASVACTPAEEAAIFAAASSGAVGSDAVDGDPVSLNGVTLNVGDQDVANAQLDFAAAKVWAVVFTIGMQ